MEQIKQLDPLRDEYDIVYLVSDNCSNRGMKDAVFVPEYRNNFKIMKYLDLVRIFLASFALMRRIKPDVIISTGSAATFPACWIQKKIYKRKVIYIESFAKRTSGTITGKLVYPFADFFIIQWEELKRVYPNAIYGGMIY